MGPISTLIRLPILMYHKIAYFNRTNEDGITLVVLHLYIHLFISILTWCHTSCVVLFHFILHFHGNLSLQAKHNIFRDRTEETLQNVTIPST